MFRGANGEKSKKNSRCDTGRVRIWSRTCLPLRPMGHALVIVESPAKARKIGEYLGDGYVVESSIGHIRDLPRGAADVPKAYKSEKWARLGIDVENDFKPLYVVSSDKKEQIKKLKAAMKDADTLYLATDKDREGEAIAWHLLEVLSPPTNVKVHRMVFTEITEKAIHEALNDPRELDRKMVDAQEARRILDRLYGYELSPVLWKKVMPRLSAGRVQSVATRIVVQRERERMAFVAASYWDLEGTFSLTRDAADGEPSNFTAKLLEVDGNRIAQGRDFSQNGQLTGDVEVIDQVRAEALITELQDQPSEVKSIDSKPYRRRPAAPFITSTLQQEASSKLKLSSAMAMRAAQGLYEKGLITYMRTDSTTLSADALDAARKIINEKYGKEFCPPEVRTYNKKAKGAQEAHEAIRPAGAEFRTPESVYQECVKSEASLYELIWQRTVASQMTDAVGDTVQVRVGVTSTSGTDTTFSASGTVITHQGFRKAYSASDADEDDTGTAALPQVAQGDDLKASDLEASGHETQPPSRYTEASLVKKLEELGVGRPSTYAAIMGTIEDRGYVWKKGSALVPSFTAFSVTNLLEGHFPNLVDYDFTAQMEVDLDGIAEGQGEAIPWLRKFYFGDDQDAGLKEKVDNRLGEIDARAINSIPLGVDANGQMVVGRVGRYGPYVQRGEERASIPDDIPLDELTIERAIEFIEAPSGDRELGDDPVSGMVVFVKNGRFGPYVQLGEIDDDPDGKPKRASVFKTMDPAEVDLETALKLLELPRTIGQHPEDGTTIIVHNGKFGPYLTKDSAEEGKKPDTRNVPSEEALLTITMDECLELLKQPKRRGRAEPKPPLAELGIDTFSGMAMVIKDGRFGPYITDGEANASLRKGDTIEEITDERASELLMMRRERSGKIVMEDGKQVWIPEQKAKKAAKKKAPAKKKVAAKKKSPAKKKAPAKAAAVDATTN
jgi:DNA topoisomerase-1